MVSKLPQFLGVGAIGFLIDACVFFGLTAGFAVGYGWARVAASLAALTSTWLMNRNSTFADGRADTAPVEFFRYLAASLAGAGANLATLSMIAPYDQALHHIPAYVIGAAAGLIVNFLLYDKFVFHRRAGRSPMRPLPPEDAP
ncbi:GtrA family protein [Bosea sp. 2YAB26]|uniref:GtrA family protein n=1 Tax=Bosea sp. 2YAB26 TaxID=3237478 RepID=UPI003F90AA8D